jgi:hypothetical protein
LSPAEIADLVLIFTVITQKEKEICTDTRQERSE